MRDPHPKSAIAAAIRDRQARNLVDALAAARAFAAQVRPDIQRDVVRKPPEPQRSLKRVVTRPLMTSQPFPSMRHATGPSVWGYNDRGEKVLK